MAAEGAKGVVNDIFRDTEGTGAADMVVEEIAKAGGTAGANYGSLDSVAGGENI